jgi:predicted nucleotidyltransferase
MMRALSRLRVNLMAVEQDQLLKLLERFQREGVQYILIGGHAVRLNGFLRNTEDIDILLPSSVENGKRVIRALSFLKSSVELDSAWFEVSSDEPENIRIADELLIDLLFAANGQTYASLAPKVKSLTIDGVEIKTLDIEGLLLTKTKFRDKDKIDREALLRLKDQLEK